MCVRARACEGGRVRVSEDACVRVREDVWVKEEVRARERGRVRTCLVFSWGEGCLPLS